LKSATLKDETEGLAYKKSIVSDAANNVKYASMILEILQSLYSEVRK
jgi:hypothetical protein